RLPIPKGRAVGRGRFPIPDCRFPREGRWGEADSPFPIAHSHGKGSGERPPTQAAANGGRPLPAGEAPPGAFAASRREPQATASLSRPQADASPRRSDAQRSAPHCHRLPPDLPPVTSPGDSRMRGTVHWLGLIALAAMMACSGDDPTDPGAVCDVTNPVVQVAVSPSMDTVHIRIPARPVDAVQLNAVVTGRAGNARSDVPVAFSSSDTTIATVTSTGLVQLRVPGRVVVRATACDQSASATIVAVAAVTTIVVNPTPDTLVAGDTLLFSARAIAATGDTLGNAVFDWTSSNTAL